MTKQPNSWLLTLRTTLFLNGKGQHRVETIYYSIAVAMGLKLDIYEILAYLPQTKRVLPFTYQYF